jgi:hypothetical protein
MFEKAGRIDYHAVDSAVPTSLGALYYKVPGFPLSFGDNTTAQHYLEHGVQIRPDGLDANFFYADFLFRVGEYAKAAVVLKHALSVPRDPERPIWDDGRRGEIRALLSQVEEKLLPDNRATPPCYCPYHRDNRMGRFRSATPVPARPGRLGNRGAHAALDARPNAPAVAALDFVAEAHRLFDRTELGRPAHCRSHCHRNDEASEGSPSQ